MLLGIRWGSMRRKIIAWFFIPTAAILLLVALVNFLAYRQVTADLVLERDQGLTRLAANQLAEELADYADTLAGLAHTAGIYQSEPAAQQAALKRASSRLAVFDGGVLILDRRGFVIASPTRADVLGQNWSNRPYAQQSWRGTGPIFSDLGADGLAGQPTIAIAVPITDDQNAFKGTLVGLIRLGDMSVSPFYGTLVKLQTGDQGKLYLVDKQGRLIFHPNPDRIGDDIAAETVVQQVLAGNGGAIRTRDLRGRDIVAGFAPVPGTPWGLITEEDWDTLLQAGQGYRQFLLFLLVLGVTVPALIVAAGVNQLTKPIASLIEATQSVAEGNFGQSIVVQTGDELETLAEQFNRMAAQLQASYAHMEQRVADRTRELAALNVIAGVVSQSLNLDEILQNALEKTLETRGMEAGAAFRLDEQSLVLHLMAQSGLSDALTRYLYQLPLAAGAAAHAVAAGRPVVRPVAHYPNGPWRNLLQAEGWQQVVSIPFVVKGKVLGAMNLFGQKVYTPTDDDIALLAAIGQQVGVAVENATLHLQAQQLAAAEERQRLARDLHDSVTQAVYSATLYAEAANRMLAAGDVNQAVEYMNEVRQTAQSALGELRLLIFELRPPILEQEGLAAALQTRLEAVERRSGLQTTFRAEGLESQEKLHPELETGLYWIAREALNNVLKHAQAQHVDVQLVGQNGHLSMTIADDGCGFDINTVRLNGRLGLTNIQERAALMGARLDIESVPGAGTKIMIKVNR